MSDVTLPSAGVRRRRDDRGAVAIVVAVLLAGGVLLGMLALVIDVGRIYVEREELQSGADAAAVAVAKACAIDSAECASPTDVQNLAIGYADANARDDTSFLQEICGYGPGRLSPCSAPASNLTACLGTPPPAPAFYVEVRLQTQMPDGSFVLPPTFAQTLAGNGGNTGTTVGACARATWDATVDLLAMTISTCEFNAATSRGTVFGPQPPYPPNPDPSDEHTIHFRAGAQHTCVPSPPGPYWAKPGPAGFLNGNSSCNFTMPAGGLMWGDDLVSPDFLPPASCESALSTASTGRDVILIGVHDAVHNDIGKTEYRHVYVAPFVVTGYFFGPVNQSASWLTSALPCSGIDETCVSGVFVGRPVSLNSLVGSSIVTLIG
jgi:Flp pilus assembly protein TadG